MKTLSELALLFAAAASPCTKTGKPGFAVLDDTYGPEPVVKLKVLCNLLTGENASVTYTSGGGVEELFLASQSHAGKEGLRKVLTTRGRNSTAVRDNLSWGGRMLLPYANRIAGGKYAFNGTEYQLPINDVAGLNNSLHGLLWNRTMGVESVCASDAANGCAEAAAVVLGYSFDGSDKGYPFRLQVAIEYRLDAAGFNMAVTASNADESGWPLPFYNGWHPYVPPPLPVTFTVVTSTRLRCEVEAVLAWPAEHSSQRSTGLTPPSSRAHSSSATAPTQLHPLTQLPTAHTQLHEPNCTHNQLHPAPPPPASYFLGDISTSKIVLDPCTQWAHVDVHQGPQYPPPRHSDMVPSTHVSPWRRNNGTDAVGCADPACSAPTYMDDEVKALGPRTRTGAGAACAGKGEAGGEGEGGAGFATGFTTRLVDAKSGQTVRLHHGANFRYLQIYTGSKAGGGEDAVVLEPLSAMSDAFNNHDGLHVISAGESLTTRFGVSIE